MLNLPRINWLLALLLLSPLLAQAETKFMCPAPDEVYRTPGEFSWETTQNGWEGLFVSPQNAIGHSNYAARFIGSRWIQFSNLPSSAGYIQCDYEGDIDSEVIRFSQTKNKSTKHPYGDYWVGVRNLHFPSVQVECTASIKDCHFEQL